MLPAHLHAVLTHLNCVLWFVLQDSCQPDVWLQLVECCAADRDSHPALRSMAQQLAALRARDAEQSALVARQQHQLWEQDARIAVLEGQLQKALAAREQQALSDR